MVFLRNLYLALSISISLFLMMMMNIVLAGPTGLTLKLIHRDSPESPVYPGRNLTRLERMERSFQRTKARYQQMTAASMNSSVRNNNNNNNTYSISPNELHPPVYFYHDDYEYIVELGIGTFNPSHEEEIDYKIYYLIIDTGSDLLWLQCEECTDCFPQDEPLFPWKKSTTYRPLPCDDLCPTGECVKHDDPCEYRVVYVDGTDTTGVFATETLTVNGDNGVNIYKMKNIIFGCGLKQEKFDYGGREKGRNHIAGILGLGGGTESFLQQLGKRGSEVKLEYCLALWTDDNSPTGTFLRFGSDTRIGGGGGQIVQTTPLYFMRGATAYYAVLIDISVGGTRIGYHEGELEVGNDGNGGCIFDTGCPWTVVSTKVYDPLKAHLIQYFADLDIHTHDPGEIRKMYELCFERPNAFDNFPKITFHFDVPTDETKSADLEIETEAAFYIDRDFFCFNILRNDAVFKSVILGAIQQANHRIQFDVENGHISWSKEKCVAGS